MLKLYSLIGKQKVKFDEEEITVVEHCATDLPKLLEMIVDDFRAKEHSVDSVEVNEIKIPGYKITVEKEGEEASTQEDYWHAGIHYEIALGQLKDMDMTLMRIKSRNEEFDARTLHAGLSVVQLSYESFKKRYDKLAEGHPESLERQAAEVEQVLGHIRNRIADMNYFLKPVFEGFPGMAEFYGVGNND